jgi:hypothetical protein
MVDIAEGKRNNCHKRLDPATAAAEECGVLPTPPPGLLVFGPRPGQVGRRSLGEPARRIRRPFPDPRGAGRRVEPLVELSLRALRDQSDGLHAVTLERVVRLKELEGR